MTEAKISIMMDTNKILIQNNNQPIFDTSVVPLGIFLCLKLNKRDFFPLSFVQIFGDVGAKPSSLCMLGKHSPGELYSSFSLKGLYKYREKLTYVFLLYIWSQLAIYFRIDFSRFQNGSLKLRDFRKNQLLVRQLLISFLCLDFTASRSQYLPSLVEEHRVIF